MELNFETVTPTCNIVLTLLDNIGIIHLDCSDKQIKQQTVNKLEETKKELGIININTEYVDDIVSLTLNPTHNINDVAKSLYNGFVEYDNLTVVIRDGISYKDITDNVIN